MGRNNNRRLAVADATVELDIGGGHSLFRHDLKCSLVHAKRSFYAAVNGLFGTIPNLASEVILELVRTKCTPILLCGLECFQLGNHVPSTQRVIVTSTQCSRKRVQQLEKT